MARGLHVVAGTAKGVPLAAPRGSRPTTSRVREAVFSALGDLTGASVLDLYAGSGAMAIEALSRGAGCALLVDDDRTAVDACEQNLETTRLAERARVRRAPVLSLLHAAAPPEAPFDLVCCDPPYEGGDRATTDVLAALEAPGWLAERARVLVERASRDGLPPLAACWEVAWERRYGDTLVAVLRQAAG